MTQKKSNYTIVVPLKRTLRAGNKGNDVLALKRALNHAGFYPGKPKNFNRTFGDSCTKAVRAYQRAWNHRHPKSKKKLARTGVYNGATHSQLVYGRNYDRYGAWLMAHVVLPGELIGKTKREQLVALSLYLASKNYLIHYSQVNRMTIVRDRMKLPPVTHEFSDDCSGLVTGLYWRCGLPDPNNRGYDGYGYTGTMIPHGRAVNQSPGSFEIGDCIIYGNSFSDTHHVAMVISHDGKVVSHGSEPGPLILPWNYRTDIVSVRRYF